MERAVAAGAAARTPDHQRRAAGDLPAHLRDEYTRVFEEVLFGKVSPSEGADEILEILTGMQPGA
ncbi:hypothetical protein [Brachybacterium sp. HMSC06H03]|uniref:hypothetical protein n=1 Tax=Brachybacterium sp. HMSC06H03 TaxID=1581127 RepID=UPI00114D23BA|nr:hypothetical protein [Brachybacterium sp. HMSC06H03]